MKTNELKLYLDAIYRVAGRQLVSDDDILSINSRHQHLDVLSKSPINRTPASLNYPEDVSYDESVDQLMSLIGFAANIDCPCLDYTLSRESLVKLTFNDIRTLELVYSYTIGTYYTLLENLSLSLSDDLRNESDLNSAILL